MDKLINTKYEACLNVIFSIFSDGAGFVDVLKRSQLHTVLPTVVSVKVPECRLFSEINSVSKIGKKTPRHCRKSFVQINVY